MKSTDKLLIGIVVGIIGLVAIAFVITLARPEASYSEENNPEAVAYNYLLALQKQDYNRAYTYLSPTIEGYPKSANQFARDIDKYSWSFRLDVDTSLSVEEVVEHEGQATVQVRESRFYGGDLFHSRQSTTTFSMYLQYEAGEWKIIDSEHYFTWCWKDRTRCR